MAALAPPVAGALYAAPPIPTDFTAHPPAAAVSALILSSCYAVTTGPDRHLYWVYNGMVSSATAITTPVTPSCCFETQDSMAVSQNKTRPRQRCALCNQSVARHMTAAQATTAFTTHAACISSNTCYIEHTNPNWNVCTSRICFCQWYYSTHRSTFLTYCTSSSQLQLQHQL